MLNLAGDRRLMTHSYRVEERESHPWMVEIRPEDGFVLNPKHTFDFRLRGVVYEMLLKAKDTLPPHLRIMVYEGFRPRARQWELWRGMEGEMRARFPAESDEQIFQRTREFIADPRGFGSGHQAGGAIDASLCDAAGKELDMGTAIVEINEKTHTHSAHISPVQQANRSILLDAMAAGGLINYPSEWWHFSYGDRLWAELTGAEVAFFGPLEEE